MHNEFLKIEITRRRALICEPVSIIYYTRKKIAKKHLCNGFLNRCVFLRRVSSSSNTRLIDLLRKIGVNFQVFLERINPAFLTTW